MEFYQYGLAACGLVIALMALQLVRYKTMLDDARRWLDVERRRRRETQGERLALQLGDKDAEPQRLRVLDGGKP
jgi:hypothetical protein